MISKSQNWPKLMSDYIQTVRHQPFLWGTFDCCLFAADAVKAFTGVDLAVSFRGKYDSGPSAYAALQEFAGGGIFETMRKLATENGMVEVPTLRAQRGDVVMLPAELLQMDVRFDGALGICIGPISLFVAPGRGLYGISTIPTPITAQYPGKVAQTKGGINHVWRIPTIARP